MIAFLIGLGGVASNLVAVDLEPWLGKFRWVVWLVFALALVTAIVAAVWESRRRPGAGAAPSRKITDRGVLWLVDRILASGEGVLHEAYDMVYFPGDDLFAVNRPRGLPIGNLTSQFWANVYLNGLDHFVKRSLQCKAYLRYVDDLLLFANGRRILWQWCRELVMRLAALRLTIHHGAHPRPVTEGIPFLGFIVFPQRRRLRRRKGIHFRRKLQALQRAQQAGDIPVSRITASVQGWVNHVRYGNTVGLRKAILLYGAGRELARFQRNT